MKRPSASFIVIMALIIAFLVSGFWGVKFDMHTPHISREMQQLLSIRKAITDFQLEYGSDPPVSKTLFFKSLLGHSSPQGIRFLDLRKCHPKPHPKGGILYDKQGEFSDVYDFWGTPLQVYIGSDGWLIRSAGKNRNFGDADDLSVTAPAITDPQ